jgi:dihydroxy-acid dehydratase/L-arabonate dehydrase
MPTIVDLQPSGRFLMEEFYYAGGLPAVLRRLGEANLIPNPNALTVNGKSIGENTKDAPIYGEDEVIRTLDNPIRSDGGICVLRGNLAPLGAVLKPSAATPALMQHRGRAVVFENFDMYKARINDPELDVDANSILVMKNCGPKGYPGMAEVGNMGLPPKLLAQGVTDMVRVSDARMSGTAYGTVVLHVAPEARAGGPLAVVRDGDWIELDCDAGRLHVDIDEKEMTARLAEWKESQQRNPADASGYRNLYIDHVLQAEQGCDFDFLVGCRGAEVPAHSH